MILSVLRKLSCNIFLPKRLKFCHTLPILRQQHTPLNQIEIWNKVMYQWVNGNAGTFTLQSSQGVIEVCHTRCSCLFYKSMCLPCRHIFSLHKKDGVSLFERSLCDTRWTTAYFRSKSTAFRNPEREYAVEVVNRYIVIYTWKKDE